MLVSLRVSPSLALQRSAVQAADSVFAVFALVQD